MELKELAKEYASLCIEIKDIKNELDKLYYETGYENDDDVIFDVRALIEQHKSLPTDEQGDIMDSYNDNYKVSYEILEKCFELYLIRKKLKQRKGYLTRLLYLRGRTLLNN